MGVGEMGVGEMAPILQVLVVKVMRGKQYQSVAITTVKCDWGEVNADGK